MKNLMIDLETMGVSNNAAIISIGAVFFDIETGKLGEEFYQVIDLESAAKFGCMDASTVQWWINQGESAKDIFTNAKKSSLPSCLQDFKRWFFMFAPKDCSVWGNGSSFDNVVLRSAYKATNISIPFAFYADRDVRTIVELGRSICNIDPKKDLPFKGVRHNALHDAKHQARYVSIIHKALWNGEEL